MAETITVQDLIADNANANLGCVAGEQALDNSIRKLGLGRGVCVDKNGKLIAGNQTQKAALRAGTKNVIVVETTGDTLVVTKRTDLDLDSDDPQVKARSRAASLADNQVTKVSQNIDMARVREQIIECSIIPADVGFTQAEIVGSSDSTGTDESSSNSSVQKLWQVVVPCHDEANQQKVYEMLVELGLSPELRTL